MRKAMVIKKEGKNADTNSCRDPKNMKKIFTSSLIMAVLIGTLTVPESASSYPAGAGLSITASSAVLIDAATQKIIYAKAPHMRRPPASTTKVMTALVVLERMKLDQVVRIPGWASYVPPSKAYLRPGERYRVRDLLHAALISSANDAAEVLAVAAAGSRARFAEWMNVKARSLGCRDTHFVNASGLPPGHHYSTAYDLALIMRQVRKNSFIVDSLSRRQHVIRSLAGRKIYLRNHNRLLWSGERSVIGKTGWTRKGRACFVGRIQWRGREIFVSLLGSHRLWQDLKVLLNYQFGVALYRVYQNQKTWSKKETLEIQRALTRAGQSPGAVDGDFGPRTVRAVELFQREHGLSSTGILGADSCKKLVPFGLSPNSCR